MLEAKHIVQPRTSLQQRKPRRARGGRRGLVRKEARHRRLSGGRKASGVEARAVPQRKAQGLARTRLDAIRDLGLASVAVLLLPHLRSAAVPRHQREAQPLERRSAASLAANLAAKQVLELPRRRRRGHRAAAQKVVHVRLEGAPHPLLPPGLTAGRGVRGEEPGLMRRECLEEAQQARLALGA